jgi:AcrR family transcriptional regulator
LSCYVSTMTGLRERKKEQTRRHIADTARRLFAERGFEHVTVSQVARAAEVSDQTVFNYFPTKEDLVYWRLGSFEDELLAAVRDRAPGESALAAFRRFLLAQRGLLGDADPDATEQLVAFTRMIDASPALQAREAQILNGYTRSLAALLAEQTGAEPGALEPVVVANALVGVHRSLIGYTRARILAGEHGPELAPDVERRAERAFALLEEGLGAYGSLPLRASGPQV